MHQFIYLMYFKKINYFFKKAQMTKYIFWKYFLKYKIVFRNEINQNFWRKILFKKISEI